jgi:hypothetical protein
MKRLAGILLMLAAAAFGQTSGGFYVNQAQGLAGQALPGAQVIVCGPNTSPCTALGEIPVFTDSSLGTPLTQPVIADQLGNFSFGCTPGKMNLLVTFGSVSQPYTDQCNQQPPVITLKTNGTANPLQTVLNIIPSAPITATPDSLGGVTIGCTGCGASSGSGIAAYSPSGASVPSHVVQAALSSPTTNACCNGPVYAVTFSSSAAFSAPPTCTFQSQDMAIPWRVFGTTNSPIFFHGVNQLSGISSIAYDGSTYATVVLNNTGPVDYGLMLGSGSTQIYLTGMTAATFLNGQPATVSTINQATHTLVLVYGLSNSVVGTTTTGGSVNVSGVTNNESFSCIGPN